MEAVKDISKSTKFTLYWSKSLRQHTETDLNVSEGKGEIKSDP